MIRRWLIRCLCLLPLTLCALGWVWSESHVTIIRYVYLHTHEVACGTACGRVGLLRVQADALRSKPDGLSCQSASVDLAADALLPGEMAWLGFRFGHFEDSTGNFHLVAAPYWFLLLLSTLFLLLAWRTTRPRPQQGQGFPVELATRKEPP